MDLMNYVPSSDNVVIELKIKDKKLTNKDGSTMTITTISPFSKEYKKIIHDISNERIKLKLEENTLDKFEEFALETLVRSTVEWNITWGGEVVKFDRELAKEIYEKAFWIKHLIQEAHAELSDFTIP